MAKTEKSEQKQTSLDDTLETVRTFLDKIHVAKASGDEWIETSPEIIQHYNRGGLNGKNYFIFDGIKVCEFGMMDQILADENEQMQFKTHGKSEGVVLGRT